MVSSGRVRAMGTSTLTALADELPMKVCASVVCLP